MKSVKKQVETQIKDQVQDHSNSLIPYGIRLGFVKNSQRITDQVWIQTSKKIWHKVWYNCN